mmetsp:Transcript_20853/g.62747  ORF Transcript_20853/g.62747 Transcript_20853/m.62747 type:complete len:329 (-) Transcript_20853:2566-3552(-)
MPTTHLPHHLGTSTSILRFGAFSEWSPLLAAALSPSSHSTPPAAVTLKDSVLSLYSATLASSSGSWQMAKSTFMLRARTETCDSTSGASGVRTATAPSGTSSSPVTRCARITVGSSYTSSWISCRPSTTSTRPTASRGLISCQAPSSAAARSPFSSGPNTRERAKAGPPRMTSSANSSTAQPATPKALPSPVEMGSTTEDRLSDTWDRARRMRSTTAAALRASSLLGRVPASTLCGSASHSARQYTTSSLSPVESARFCSRGPTRGPAAAPVALPAPRSAAPLATFSSARSRYSISLLPERQGASSVRHSTAFSISGKIWESWACDRT